MRYEYIKATAQDPRTTSDQAADIQSFDLKKQAVEQ
jgi:hypothetical protein